MLKGFFKATKQREDAVREHTLNELKSVERSLKESEKFLEVLNKDTEGPFTDFSPKIMNAAEINRREELIKERDRLKGEKIFLEKQIEGIDRYLGRLDIAEKVVDELIAFQTKYSVTYEDILISIMSAHDNLPEDPEKAKAILYELSKKISN